MATGMIRLCGGCHRPIDDQLRADAAPATQAAMFPPVANGLLMRVQPTPVATIARPAAPVVLASPEEMTASGYVAAMRGRLAGVKARLAEVAPLRAEEALLERMLAAVDPPN